VECIDATLADVALANELADAAFGRSLDELPPQTRRFLEELLDHVSQACEARHLSRSAFRVGRRDLLDWTGLSLTVIRRHLQRLIDHEYVLTHRGKNGESFVYELLYGGEARERSRFVLGLTDPARRRYGKPPCSHGKAPSSPLAHR
jgi:hypothetical protein